MLTASELWLFRLMGDRGQALLDADCLLILVDEASELRIAAAAGSVSPRVRIAPRRGSATGALFERGEALSLERPRGSTPRGWSSSDYRLVRARSTARGRRARERGVTKGS